MYPDYVQISPTTRLVLRIAQHDNRPFVDIRVDFLDEITNTYKPTKKGVHIALKHFQEFYTNTLTPFISALQAKET